MFLFPCSQEMKRSENNTMKVRCVNMNCNILFANNLIHTITDVQDLKSSDCSYIRSICFIIIIGISICKINIPTIIGTIL